MNSNELILSESDFARLRVLAAGHDLSAELDRVIVIPEALMPLDVVGMHSRVRYLDERLGSRREVELVYPDEADAAQGRISVLAPVGSALLGLAAGDAIDWKYPDGKIHRLRVEQVLPRGSAARVQGAAN